MNLNLIIAILLSFSCNLDNILLGMIYGKINYKIKFINSALISSVTTIITYIFIKIGSLIGIYISKEFVNILCGIFLIIIGVYFILKEIFLGKSNEQIVRNVGLIDILKASVYLSLNNIPIAITSGIASYSTFYMLIFSFVFSSFFLYLGNVIGIKIKGKVVSIVSSCIFILLGILELVFVD